MHSHLRGHPALVDAVRRLEKLKPDEFEIYFQKKVSTLIDSKEMKVDSLARSEDLGISIRVIKDKRLGFSFTTSLEKDAIDRAAETALEVARFMPEDPHVGFYSFGSSVYPSVDNFDTNGTGVALAKKVEMAHELEAACRKADARVKAVRSARVAETLYEVHLVDSEGEHIHHQNTLYSASISCKAEQGPDQCMGHDFGFSSFLDNLDIHSVAKEAARTATEILGAGQAPTMKCPAVLKNSVVAELLEFVSASFSAEQIDKGRSMLAGKLGTSVFSDQITIADDGLMAGGYGTSPFDAEGVPSGKTLLIEQGTLVGSLYDTYYARKYSKEPTASASRGIKSPPSIGFSNLYIQGGRLPYATLFEGISRGVLITDLMGLHTANEVTGDFSLGASGILIENGNLTRPVRGFAVAGNVLDLFKRITDLGNDLRFFGSIGAPSFRVSEISVGGV